MTEERERFVIEARAAGGATSAFACSMGSGSVRRPAWSNADTGRPVKLIDYGADGINAGECMPSFWSGSAHPSGRCSRCHYVPSSCAYTVRLAHSRRLGPRDRCAVTTSTLIARSGIADTGLFRKH